MSYDLTVWLNKLHTYCVHSFRSDFFVKICEIMQICIAEYINDVHMNDVSGAQTLSSNEGTNTRLSSSPPKSCTSCSSSTPIHKKGKCPFSFFFSFFPCVNELLYLTVFVLFLLYSRLPDLEDFTLISHYLCSNAVLVIMVVEFDQRPGGLCKEAERVGIVGPCRNLIVAFEYLKRGYEKARERSSSGIVVVW